MKLSQLVDLAFLKVRNYFRDLKKPFKQTWMKITINGKTISVQGSNVSVVGNRIIVDGNTIVDNAIGVCKVEVEGDLVSLNSSVSVDVTGNVNGDVEAGSSVRCGNVSKNVEAGSSVQCGDVGGDVDAGSSVKCGNVQGSVDAGSSITKN